MKMAQKIITGGMSRTRMAVFSASFPEAAAAALHMAHCASAVGAHQSASAKVALKAIKTGFITDFISGQCPPSTAALPANL